jgi:DNA-directed RNA polymerase subunit beta'
MENLDLKNIIDFSGLIIKLASPEEIRSWSRGEVTKPETINYRTLRSEKDGLFCERIFGPTKNWECYCGKYKRIRYRGIVCDKCGVEITQSRVRRERMGHITLAAPCAHVWFFKGAPSKLSLLLDITPRALEAVIYFAQYLVLEIDEAKKKKAISQLEANLKEKLNELRKATEKEIKVLNKEVDGEVKTAKKKIKDKEQLGLALEELELKRKQKAQVLRDDLVLELERAEEIFKNLMDKVKGLKKSSLLTEDEHLKLQDYKAAGFFEVAMGSEALLKVIKSLDLGKLISALREEAAQASGQRYVKATKRLRVVGAMKKARIDPAWMILRILPVIPPDLRPMVQLAGGRFATSDLNDLYRRVINRNNRLKHLIDLGAPEIILRNEKRMLQEAVDSLIDASQRARERRRYRRREPRSLSDMLKGKQGRFRRNLLGKRVDYSGRSVIVVGPELKLKECGLPKEMALEMFKPYLLREMILRGLSPNVRSAKNLLEHRPPEIFDILEEITRDHPVLLNRAPTLHKLGIQAFYPILIEGNAIQIHPAICYGFNADFDGDQMAVHIPLSKAAIEEAIGLMMPDKNILKPADGSPIAIPERKEMALGAYYLTSIDPNLEPEPTVFSDSHEAILAYQADRVKLRQPIRVRLEKAMGGNNEVMETTIGRLLANEVIPEKLRFFNQPLSRDNIRKLFDHAFSVCAREELVQLIDDIKDLSFEAGTISGLSFSMIDNQLYPGKGRIIARANKKVEGIENNYRQGLITNEERRRLVQEIWLDTTEELTDKTWESFDPANPVKLMIDAGVGRVSRDTLKQLSAMRGLVVDPLGKIVDLPTKSNFREGLSVFEYVTSTRGSRKGLTDTAIKTSDAGYLTRRLVDVSHDALIREIDCGTKEGIKIDKEGERTKKFNQRVLGRILSQDVVEPKTKKVILKKGEEIGEETLSLLEKAKIEEIFVRSPLTCEARHGLCQQCYGWDFSNKKIVEVGTPVGIIAAQSIGEPGTQLTLRTKHTGGVVGLDVTQGLPRVEELFEVRTPKKLSPLAEVSGRISVAETDEGYKVRVKSLGVKPVEEREYIIPLTSTLWVKDGDKIEAGMQLASGALDVKDILEVKGLKAAQEYLIQEVQAVYESQGIPINDKHFEVIVRKMSDKVRISNPGDTEFLLGELTSRAGFEAANSEVMAEGGEPATAHEPATAQVIVLGITRSAISTESWLSASSFINTTIVLTDAAISGKEDSLLGLKENVIIGRLIPVTPERAKLEK